MSDCIDERPHAVHHLTGHCKRCGLTAEQIAAEQPTPRPVPMPVDDTPDDPPPPPPPPNDPPDDPEE